MSTLVEALPTLKETNIMSSNVKDEERKIESLSCELRENTDIAKDLSKEITKKGGCHIEDVDTQVKEIVNDDAAPKSDNTKTSNIDLKCTSNNQLENHDKTGESLSNEKQQLPISIGVSIAEGFKLPEVQILSLSVISPGRADIVLPIPFPSTTSKATLFTLKEGSKYRIKFHLTVSGSTIHDLKYTYMVWKSGIKVHQTKKLVGTFSPRQEPYVYELEEGTTPTGFFARGPFFVKSKFVDDDGNCYLDTTYYFDIRKDWGATDNKSR